MQVRTFLKTRTQITNFAKPLGWGYQSQDPNTGRLSLKTDDGVYKVDIYLTKMTVCLIPVGGKPAYLKKQTMSQLKQILTSPHDYAL